MARTIYFDGPVPPPGESWCAICAMFAKQHVIAANKGIIQVAHRGSDDEPPLRIDMTPVIAREGLELQVAVTKAISTVVPQYGALDLCWSHVLGLEPMPSGVMPASPQEQVMLSQAAQIGQRRLPAVVGGARSKSRQSAGALRDLGWRFGRTLGCVMS